MLAGLSAFEPTPEGGLRLTRTPTGEESFDADVLIEIGPVNALAVADESPTRALSIGAVRKPWVPCERYTDGPAVDQVDNQ